MTQNQKVRFQVPVSEDLASEITFLAERLGRSSAWLAEQLLEQTLEDRKRVAEWLALAVLGTVYETTKKLLTGKKRRKPEIQEEVRLQLFIPENLAKEVEEAAAPLRIKPVKMAALFIEAGVFNHEAIILAVTTKQMKSITGIAASKKGVKHAACCI